MMWHVYGVFVGAVTVVVLASGNYLMILSVSILALMCIPFHWVTQMFLRAAKKAWHTPVEGLKLPEVITEVNVNGQRI